jgi:predicted DNA-binding protein
MNVRLSESQLAWINAEAKKTTKTKSTIVRECISAKQDEEIITVEALARILRLPFNDVAEIIHSPKQKGNLLNEATPY